MFTSLSKIISWSPNPWCDGVMVHEVFDRVLARLGLERGKTAGSSHVTARQLTSWDSGLTLSVNRSEWCLLCSVCCAAVALAEGTMRQQRLSSHRVPSLHIYLIFCLFLKNCLGPQLLIFLLRNLIFLLHCRSWVCYPVPCTGSYTTDTHMGAFPF